MRLKLSPKIQEQLSKLKKIPVEKIRGFMTPIVDIPIGELSLKMSHRALYVLSSTLINVRNQTNKLVEIFEKREIKIKKLIEKYESDLECAEDKDIAIETVLNDLKCLLVTEEDLKKQLEEKSCPNHSCDGACNECTSIPHSQSE